MKPKLSIIIPVHNDPRTLNLCLDALLESINLANLEQFDITVIDDASDDPVNLPDRFKTAVRVIRNDLNRGQSYSRNRGAQMSQGDFLLFVDSDAVVEKEALGHAFAFMQTPRPEALIGMQGLFSETHPHNSWPSLIYNCSHILTDHPHRYNLNLNGSFFLVERAAFERIGMFHEDFRFLEDCEFSRRMANSGCYLQNGPARFVHYKRASWRWIFEGVFFGGIAQCRIIATPAAQIKKKQLNPMASNNVFRNWLLQGLMGILGTAGFLIAKSSFKSFFFLTLTAPALISAARMWNTLWKSKKNPAFCVVGILALFTMPWFIAMGILAAFIHQFENTPPQPWRRSRPVSKRH